VSPQSILPWVVSATATLLPSQSRILALLVATAIRSERPKPRAERPEDALTGHRQGGHPSCLAIHLQRAVKVGDAMAGVIDRLVRSSEKRLLVKLRLDRCPSFPHPDGGPLHWRPGGGVALGQRP
jgi:hypothetical protein